MFKIITMIRSIKSKTVVLIMIKSFFPENINKLGTCNFFLNFETFEYCFYRFSLNRFILMKVQNQLKINCMCCFRNQILFKKNFSIQTGVFFFMFTECNSIHIEESIEKCFLVLFIKSKAPPSRQLVSWQLIATIPNFSWRIYLAQG